MLSQSFRPLRPRLPNLRRVLLLLATVMALLPLGACKKSTTEHEPGVAVIIPVLRTNFIRNFNPFFESQARWPTTAGIYEPTVIFNRATGEFVPWLAEEWWWQDDNKRLVLKIREGVQWSDGKPLRPEDVAFTFRLMKKHEELDQSSVWKHIDKLEVKGRQVHFFFNHPFTTPVLFMIGRQPIIPEHIWKDVKDPVRFPNEEPVGSGPYNQVLTFRSQVYEIGANPNYWQKGKPGLKKFRLPAIGGNDAQTLALVKGDIDWAAGFIPAIDRIFVGKDPKHHGYHFPSLEGTVMLYANTTKTPYEKPEVRKALSQAIDRDLIVKIAMQGYTRKADATGLSDLYKNWLDEKVLQEEGDWTQFNPEKAKQMLDAAGLKVGKNGYRSLPDGSPWEVDVNCVVGWSDWITGAEIIVKNLRAVGIDATLRTYAFGAWFNKLQTGEFQLSMSWSDGAATPWSFYMRQMSTDSYRPIGENAENNWQRFISKKADKLLQAFASSADATEQQRIASELQREFVKMAPAIPLFPGPTWGQYNTRRVEGFPTKENQYAALAPYKAPGMLLTMVELHPTGTPALSKNPGTGAPGRGHVPFLEKTEEKKSPEPTPEAQDEENQKAPDEKAPEPKKQKATPQKEAAE